MGVCGVECATIVWSSTRSTFLKKLHAARKNNKYKNIPSSLQKTRGHKVLSSLTSNVLAGLFFLGLSASQLQAIEMTKASALQLDFRPAQTQDFSSSPSSNLANDADSCLPLLKQVRLSSKESAVGQNRRPSFSQNSAGKKASMPVTLGFLIGVRVALGPKEVVKSGRRVQVGPEILQRYDTGESYALAVAEYRQCKRQAALHTRP